MNQSAKNIAKKHNDPVVKSEHFPGSGSRKQDYINEHKDIDANGGAGNKQENYNQINSPGKKLVEGGN